MLGSASVSAASTSRERDPWIAKLRQRRRDIVDGDLEADGRPLQHALDVPVCRVARDDDEVRRAELGDGQVGLQSSIVVQPLGVGDHARVAVDIAGAEGA